MYTSNTFLILEVSKIASVNYNPLFILLVNGKNLVTHVKYLLIVLISWWMIMFGFHCYFYW